MRRNSQARGAALILEIIIYLVIVALIAVAVTSGVRAVRDLVFTMHAKNDISQLHSYMEGRYSQDGTYPVITYADNATYGFNLTQVGNDKNRAKIQPSNASNNPGYCIAVTSATISGQKKLFWSTSDKPGRIMQRGTATESQLGGGPLDGLCYLPVDTGIGEG